MRLYLQLICDEYSLLCLSIHNTLITQFNISLILPGLELYITKDKKKDFLFKFYVISFVKEISPL